MANRDAGRPRAIGARKTRTYNPDSGLLTQLDDSDAGTFTASYDADGKLTSKTYPNGIRADTTYDETDSPVAVRYTKTSNCESNCTWLDESTAIRVRVLGNPARTAGFGRGRAHSAAG